MVVVQRLGDPLGEQPVLEIGFPSASLDAETVTDRNVQRSSHATVDPLTSRSILKASGTRTCHPSPRSRTFSAS